MSPPVSGSCNQRRICQSYVHLVLRSAYVDVYSGIIHIIVRVIDDVDTSMDEYHYMGFGVKEPVFIANRLNDEGVKPDSTKVEAIDTMDRPTYENTLQR